MKHMQARNFIDVLQFSDAKGDLPAKIHLIPIGKWNTTKYGEVEVNRDMLTEMANNFSRGLRAGVPIDVDHDAGKAAGWINSVTVADDGLWGDVEWTPYGQTLLKNKEYKFLSPEFNLKYADPLNADAITANVLIGAGLVNRPLFRNLKPLTASEEGNLTASQLSFILETEPMKTQDILNKQVSEVTAEEREFLKVHASELSDEQKKQYGLLETKPPAKAEEPKEAPAVVAAPPITVVTAKEESKTITASEYSELIKAREQVEELKKATEKKDITADVEKMCFSEDGVKLKAESKGRVVDFVLSLSAPQRVTFSEIIKELPTVKIFGEKGTAKDNKLGDDREAFSIRATEIATEKKIAYRDALSLAAKENPNWAEYDYSVQPVKEQE